MQKVGILYHPKKDSALPIVEKIRNFLETKGVSTWICSAWEVEQARSIVNGTELIITVGGDGTILRAVQSVVPNPVPITGINLGNLGFMTELAVDETEEKLVELLEGKGWIDERYLLEAELITNEGKSSGKYYALNDVVLARGEIARVVHVEARINQEHLTTYKADGVIVSTATGSTGYSLAASGPILYRNSREMLLVPVTPHLSSGYSLVLPDSAIIELTLDTFYSATLSIDGHINSTLYNGDKVTIKQSGHTVRFLRIHPENAFYSSLERKLKGKI
ncbi:MAG: NAD(+)/NADH kinase [Dehalococcoidales bacterium]|nr:NAD(+)/NADH kinase [Dehalococcoidales bacterium]